MRTKYIVIALSIAAFVSCKKELEPQESSQAQEITAPTASTAPAQQQLPVNAQPDAAMQPGMQMTPQPVAQAPAPVAKGMNPAHGQPGHRCEIPVGAPLNSAPAKTPASKASPFTVTPTQAGSGNVTEINPGGAPALLSTPSTPAATPTAPGMNPPHGQEGHKCEIAVGAPLNSAPEKK